MIFSAKVKSFQQNLLIDLNTNMKVETDKMCTSNWDDDKFWFLYLALTLNLVCLMASVYDNGGSMFTSRLNKTKFEFTTTFKIFTAVIIISNITMLATALPVCWTPTECPQELRIYFLFDMLLFTGKVINISLEFYHSRVLLG